MFIQFEDEALAQIETEAAVFTQLPVSVIEVARKRLQIIRAAPDFTTLKNWKSLGLRMADEVCSFHRIELSPHWSMRIEVKEIDATMTVVVKDMDQTLRGWN